MVMLIYQYRYWDMKDGATVSRAVIGAEMTFLPDFILWNLQQ